MHAGFKFKCTQSEYLLTIRESTIGIQNFIHNKI